MTRLALPAVLAATAGLHLLWAEPSEPFFNGDETRHVMTGVFVRDALRDGGWTAPRAYAERYYAQYPALGLLVWPPGFYAVEGVAMTLFGPTYAVARVLTVGYALVASAYLFALARRTHGLPTAVVAALVFGVARDVFAHARVVMLEVPMAACAFGAVFHLERYLAAARRRDLILVGAWTVAAGLHRYDAVFLAPVFAFRLLLARDWRPLVRREVLWTAAGVVALLAPVYLLAAREIGSVHTTAAASGTNAEVVGPTAWDRITFYPAWVWFQVGHVAFAAGCVGLVVSFRRGAQAHPYWAVLAAVYATFTPLAEHETRHSVPWLLAWCVFAADAALLPLRYGRPWLAGALAVGVIGHSAFWTLKQPVPWVRGYADAAGYVVANAPGPPVVLFDGLQDGTFVFQVRAADPGRRAWVLRGDKLLYAVRSDPHAGYVEWVDGGAAVLGRIAAADPDFVVVEDPLVKYPLPMAKQLRALLAGRPELFERVAAFPVHSNNQQYVEGVELVVYRPRHRGPPGPRRLDMRMLWQGTTVPIDLPPRE